MDLKNAKGEALRLDYQKGEASDVAIAKMADGNPKVIILLAEMVNAGAGSGLFVLDMLGLYGDELWQILEEKGGDFNDTMDEFARLAQAADAAGIEWQPVPEGDVEPEPDKRGQALKDLFVDSDNENDSRS